MGSNFEFKPRPVLCATIPERRLLRLPGPDCITISPVRFPGFGLFDQIDRYPAADGCEQVVDHDKDDGRQRYHDGAEKAQKKTEQDARKHAGARVGQRYIGEFARQ